MSLPSLRIPGADAHGFVDGLALRKTAHGMSEQTFASSYPTAALEAEIVLPQLGDSADGQGSLGPQLLTVSDRSLEGLRYHGCVAFLTKRPGNPFPLLISIGRSVSNDLVVAIDSISKMHGYFTRTGEDWWYADRSSTNGSLLNGERLEPESKHSLSAGDSLQLGPNAIFRFETTAGMFRRLCAPPR